MDPNEYLGCLNNNHRHPLLTFLHDILYHGDWFQTNESTMPNNNVQMEYKTAEKEQDMGFNYAINQHM